jgi:hypothetical protein
MKGLQVEEKRYKQVDEPVEEQVDKNAAAGE